MAQLPPAGVSDYVVFFTRKSIDPEILTAFVPEPDPLQEQQRMSSSATMSIANQNDQSGQNPQQPAEQSQLLSPPSPIVSKEKEIKLLQIQSILNADAFNQITQEYQENEQIIYAEVTSSQQGELPQSSTTLPTYQSNCNNNQKSITEKYKQINSSISPKEPMHTDSTLKLTWRAGYLPTYGNTALDSSQYSGMDTKHKYNQQFNTREEVDSVGIKASDSRYNDISNLHVGRNFTTEGYHNELSSTQSNLVYTNSTTTAKYYENEQNTQATSANMDYNQTLDDSITSTDQSASILNQSSQGSKEPNPNNIVYQNKADDAIGNSGTTGSDQSVTTVLTKSTNDSVQTTQASETVQPLKKSTSQGPDMSGQAEKMKLRGEAKSVTQNEARAGQTGIFTGGQTSQHQQGEKLIPSDQQIQNQPEVQQQQNTTAGSVELSIKANSPEASQQGVQSTEQPSNDQKESNVVNQTGYSTNDQNINGDYDQQYVISESSTQPTVGNDQIQEQGREIYSIADIPQALTQQPAVPQEVQNTTNSLSNGNQFSNTQLNPGAYGDILPQLTAIGAQFRRALLQANDKEEVCYSSDNDLDECLQSRKKLRKLKVPIVFHVFGFLAEGKLFPPEPKRQDLRYLVRRLNLYFRKNKVRLRFYVQKIQLFTKRKYKHLVLNDLQQYQSQFSDSRMIPFAQQHGVNMIDTINVFVVGDPRLPQGESIQSGYATQPRPHTESADQNMVVMGYISVDRYGSNNENEYDGGAKVLAHEIGHVFGLQHTFIGSNNGCTAGEGDCIKDTAMSDGTIVQQQFSKEAAVWCQDQSLTNAQIPAEWNSCNLDDQPDPLLNFMMYSFPQCPREFTKGQRRRMECVAQVWKPTMARTRVHVHKAKLSS